jgi:hypothetical protein
MFQAVATPPLTCCLKTVVSFPFTGNSSPATDSEQSAYASSFSANPGAALRDLESRCLSFLVQGLAPTSRRMYTAVQHKFWQFVQALPAVFPHSATLPVSESQLMLFVSWLAQTLSPATVAVYLAAVRGYLILHRMLSVFGG